MCHRKNTGQLSGVFSMWHFTDFENEGENILDKMECMRYNKYCCKLVLLEK